MKSRLFDIYYISNKKVDKAEGIKKENVEHELNKIFEDESIIFAGVAKHKKPDTIFYHSVFRGTIIKDKNYKAPRLKRKGVTIMKLGRDGYKQVRSNYPRWDYHMIEHCEGELNIDELLENI